MDAAKAAGVQHIVYLSVVMPPGSEVIPHFASKIPVEQAVQASGIPWTILRPNNFFQNDLWFRDAITTYGVYPQPLGPRGLNRVDVRDIAEAAANAFTRGVGGVVPLNGPRGLTGDDTARVYSEILRRPVRYGGDDLDVWAKQASAMMPPWMVQDMRIMYDYFIRQGRARQRHRLRRPAEPARPRAAAVRGVRQRAGDGWESRPQDPGRAATPCPSSGGRRATSTPSR